METQTSYTGWELPPSDEEVTNPTTSKYYQQPAYIVFQSGNLNSLQNLWPQGKHQRPTESFTEDAACILCQQTAVMHYAGLDDPVSIHARGFDYPPISHASGFDSPPAFSYHHAYREPNISVTADVAVWRIMGINHNWTASDIIPFNQPLHQYSTSTAGTNDLFPQQLKMTHADNECESTKQNGLNSSELAPALQETAHTHNMTKEYFIVDFGTSDKGLSDCERKPRTVPVCRRKRTANACTCCRIKKIRCSGEIPTCSQCLSTENKCAYRTAHTNARRRGHKHSVNGHLQSVNCQVREPTPGPASDIKSPQAESVKTADDQTEVAIATDDYVAMKDFKSEDGGQNQWEGDLLPGLEVQEHLAEIFFNRVYGQAYYLLHKPTFMDELRHRSCPPVLILAVCAISVRFDTKSPGEEDEDCFRKGEAWASHARGICTQACDQPSVSTLTSLIILSLHEFGTCNGDRSWALGGQAISMAYHLQLHKDLDHDIANPRIPLSVTEREVRRRLMWACFMLDRFISSGAERPMFINERSIEVPLPVSEELFFAGKPAPTELLIPNTDHIRSTKDATSSPMEGNMGVSAYMIRSVAVWGRIIAYIHQGGRQLDVEPPWTSTSGFSQLKQDIDQMHKTLPTRLQFSIQNLDHQMENDGASHFLLLHLSLQQNILTLYRFAVSGTGKRMVHGQAKGFADFSSAQAFSAAIKISDMVKEAECRSLSIPAPFAAYCAYSATNIHILAVILGNAAVEAVHREYIEVNMRFLRKMARHWGIFRWMADTVSQQYSKALDTSEMDNSAALAWQILNYGDWFTEYPK